MQMKRHIFRLVLGIFLSLLVVWASVGLLALAGLLICGAAIAGLHPATAIFFNYFLPAGGIRFFALLRIGSRYGERVITHDATFRILSDLRAWFYRKLEPLVPGYFLRYRAGDLLNRSVSDIDTLNQIYLRIFMPFVVAILLSISLLIFFHYFSWNIAWSVFIGMLSIVFVVSALSGWLGNKISKRHQLIMADHRIHVLDLIGGMKELLLYAASHAKINRISQLQMALYQCQRRLTQIRGLSTALVILISGIMIWLALYFAIPLVAAHTISAPILCLIVLAILAAFEVLMPLPAAFQEIGGTSVAISRLKEIANEKPMVTFPSQSIAALTNYDIEFKNVNFSYHPDHPVLENINLSIPFGTKQIIVGPSGAGKTTLLHLLARFYDPSRHNATPNPHTVIPDLIRDPEETIHNMDCFVQKSQLTTGEITIGGEPIKNLSESDLRDVITLVTQQDHIFNETIRNNLLFANTNASDEMLWKVLKKVKLDSILKNREGLDTPMGEFGQHFSAGQLRRFSIARALLRNTPIMMFDEPTEGLDDANAALVWELLLNDLEGHTVIIVSHRLPNKDIEMFNVFSCRPI